MSGFILAPCYIITLLALLVTFQLHNNNCKDGSLTNSHLDGLTDRLQGDNIKEYFVSLCVEEDINSI